MNDEQLADVSIICKDCRKPFIFTVRDQEYYAQRGFEAPKRCKPCRDIKKSTFGGQSQRER